MRVKIGSVPYLNARPLVDWLERVPHTDVDVVYAVPSVLIPMVRAGEVDIAMASTFATFEDDTLHLLPTLGVTATGPAESVRLLSRVPIREIRTLALDACSRSSVAMARIILADRYDITPDCLDLPPVLENMLARADAGVLIGDIGFRVGGEGLLDVDLGAEWHALTGLPFFFAGWVARDMETLEQAAPLLHESLEYGLARLPAIAEEEGRRLELPAARCYHYLADVMRYHAGDAEMAGLTEFRRRADRLGLLRESG